VWGNKQFVSPAGIFLTVLLAGIKDLKKEVKEMVFSPEIVEAAFRRANSKCESCGKQLVFQNRGRGSGRGAWEVHHRTKASSGGGDTLSNCKILCWDCHSKTF